MRIKMNGVFKIINVLLIIVLLTSCSNVKSQLLVDRDGFKYLEDLRSKLEWKNDFDLHEGVPSAVKDINLFSGKYYWVDDIDGSIIKITYEKEANILKYKMYDTILANYKKEYSYRVGIVKNKMLVHAETYIDGEIWHYNSYKYPSKEIPRIIIVENEKGEFVSTEQGKMLKLIPKGIQINNGGGNMVIKDCINDSICESKNYYNGNLESEGDYNNHRKDGVWKYYNEDRRIIKEEIWESGKLIDIKEFKVEEY